MIPIENGKNNSVKPKVRRQPVIGTVKSSKFEGLRISITVELNASKKDNITIQPTVITCVLFGNIIPKKEKPNKLRINAVINKAMLPSTLRIVFVYLIFILCLPYFFPINEAIASDTVVISATLAKIGKGANINGTKQRTNGVDDTYVSNSSAIIDFLYQRIAHLGNK